MKKIILSVFILILFWAGLARAGNPGNDLTAILPQAMPAVVNIQAEGEVKPQEAPFAENGNNHAPQQRKNGHFVSIGSAVIVDAAKGYMLTNAHVIYQADNITVTLNDGRRYKAKILGLDVGFDLAILQINARNITAIPIGDSDKLKVGDFVTTIGSPFNLKQTVTSGIVSGLHRSINLEGNEDFIQTDASINLGSSGGALINSKGELVGINTAILAPEGGNIGIGFAIPINLARNVTQQLTKYGSLQRGLLGILIQNLNPDLAAALNADASLTGALVSQVNPASPAAAAGLREGDIITAVDGKKITKSAELVNYVSLQRPGAHVTLSVMRGGSQLSITTTLVSQKAYKQKLAEQNDSVLAGVALENFDQMTINYGHVKGVQAAQVDPNSDAWSAMLRPGDVITSINQTTVNNLADVKKILATSPERLLLHVLREDGGFYLMVP